MPKISQATQRARAQAIVQGVARRLSSWPAVPVSGQKYSPAQIAARYQEYLAALDALDAARAALRSAVRDERRRAREVAAFTLGLRQIVFAHFGLSEAVFADFGWRLPKKPGPKTLPGKVAGAQKSRATRAARRTMGPRQKEKIRGGAE